MKRFRIVLLAAVLSACSNPNDVVFGADPFGQIDADASQFAHLSDADRSLLADYLIHADIQAALGHEQKAVTGKTLGTVLHEAHVWRNRQPSADHSSPQVGHSASIERGSEL